jgi:hypothetical protein
VSRIEGPTAGFWNHKKHALTGYQQSGDVHGNYFGTWLRQLDDGELIIITFGDKTKRYWLRIGECYHGNYATPERAALAARKLLAAQCDRVALPETPEIG